MSTDTTLTVEARIRQLLQHLGLQRAHFAGRLPRDWTGLAAGCPECCASLTLVCPMALDPQQVARVADRLLVVNGDQGAPAERVRRGTDALPTAHMLTLRDYSFAVWSDVVADRGDEIGSAMLQFLAAVADDLGPAGLAEGEGEAAGITYRVRGAGPPLVLLPLWLSPSQWEPLIGQLSEQYCTITLGGAELGMVAVLESRGRSAGYQAMVRNLIEAAQIMPGETVLEVGCGTGVLSRWLARHTGGANRITGVDINSYLLREAGALAAKERLADTVAFREGDAERLPLDDQSVDVVLSVTVMEEGDAHQMLAELLRVTKPGGRVVVIVRALDRPFMMNLPLRGDLLERAENPRGWTPGMGQHGCADASLYQRFQRAGLAGVRPMPQLMVLDAGTTVFLEFMQGLLLPTLSREEAQEWREARAQAEAAGTFFIAWPHHGAVGTKPQG